MDKSGSDAMKHPLQSDDPLTLNFKASVRQVATPSRSTSTRLNEWSQSSDATTAAASGSPSSVDSVDSPLSSPLVAICTEAPVSATGRQISRQIYFKQEAGVAEVAPESIDQEAGVVAEVAPAESPGRVYWESFFVNLPIFCGYAALFGLQHEIKSKLGISDDDIYRSREFGVAASFLYIFNLIFRFSHNIVFSFVGPRGRAFIAMASMMASMFVIAGAIFIVESKHMGWVVLAYALGGVSVGTFEANFLCCLTPLGPETKHLAITAIPVGVTSVLVGGFFAMGPPLHIPALAIYLAVGLAVFLGMILFSLRIPHVPQSGEQPGLRQFITQGRQWRQWLPLIWHLPFATVIDMFCLSAFSPGLALYIYDAKTVTLAPGLVMPTNSFFALYNVFNMMGGLLGRIMSYRVKPRHPLCYTVFSLCGASILLLKIPLLAPISTFIVMVGDGFIYGTIARRIDDTVPKEFNLVALSFWLFVGDFGSVTGSNMISYMKQWLVAH